MPVGITVYAVICQYLAPYLTSCPRIQNLIFVPGEIIDRHFFLADKHFSEIAPATSGIANCCSNTLKTTNQSVCSLLYFHSLCITCRQNFLKFPIWLLRFTIMDIVNAKGAYVLRVCDSSYIIQMNY